LPAGGFSYAAVACADSQSATSAQRHLVICAESFTGAGKVVSFAQRQIVARLTPKWTARAESAT
jgi:hypothetical protein